MFTQKIKWPIHSKTLNVLKDYVTRKVFLNSVVLTEKKEKCTWPWTYS